MTEPGTESSLEATTVGDDDVSIDFSDGEILVLCDLLGVEPPSGLSADSLADLSTSGRVEPLRHAVLRTLRVRGVLSGDAPPEVVPAVADIIEASANPGLMVAAAIDDGAGAETRRYWVRPQIAVEQRSLTAHLHRFTPFATRDLLARIFDFAPLPDGEPGLDHRFVAPDEVVRRADELVDAGDPSAATRTLVEAGVDEASAAAFVEAVGARAGSASVTLLHRSDDDTITGGALTWLDAGSAGLWVSDSDTEAADGIVILCTDRASVVAELVSYLPAAFDGAGTIVG